MDISLLYKETLVLLL